MSREYKNMNDCWKAIREYDNQGKSYEELIDLLDEFPKWSGDWEVEYNEYHNCLVINTYYDENNIWQQETESTDIPWPMYTEFQYCAYDLNDNMVYGEFDTLEECEKFIEDDQGDHNLIVRVWNVEEEEWEEE